jgi:membrane fusion protein (multidrug efflux system)
MFPKLSRLLESKRFFRNNRNATLMLVLGIIVGVLIIWLIFKSMQPMVRSFCTYILESDEAGVNRQGRIISVEGEIVKTGTMTKRISTVGKIRANAAVMIRSEAHGRIKELAFTEGASVKKGQPIILFEDADAQAEVKLAEAEVALRKADFDRIHKLYQQKIGSTKEYDKARAELAIAGARLEAARAKLDKTVIKAPFDGTIGLIDVSVGAYVQAGQDLVNLVDATPIKVDFKIPEKHVHDVGVGQTVEVRIDAFKDRVFKGAVEAVDSQVEAESHSLSVRGSIPNEDLLLRPGLFANISLIIGEQGDIIQVDEAAVDREGEIEFVWVVEKGKAVRRRVLTGIRENGKIEIIAGIRPGQVIVTAGQLKLSDGVKVKLTNLELEEEKKTTPESEANKSNVSKAEEADKKETSSKAEVSKEDSSPQPKGDEKATSTAVNDANKDAGQSEKTDSASTSST